MATQPNQEQYICPLCGEHTTDHGYVWENDSGDLIPAHSYCVKAEGEHNEDPIDGENWFFGIFEYQ